MSARLCVWRRGSETRHCRVRSLHANSAALQALQVGNIHAGRKRNCLAPRRRYRKADWPRSSAQSLKNKNAGRGAPAGARRRSHPSVQKNRGVCGGASRPLCAPALAMRIPRWTFHVRNIARAALKSERARRKEAASRGLPRCDGNFTSIFKTAPFSVEYRET